MTATKQPKKCPVLVTYLIAVVCLLLGLLLPFYGKDNAMLATMLPSALSNVLGLNWDIGTTFAYANSVSFFGLFSVDLNSLLVVLYAVITLVGVIILIPQFICKKKKTSFACATTVEILAVIVLSIYIFSLVGSCASYDTDAMSAADFASAFSFDWCVIGVAFGGTLLMLLIQTFNYHKASGAAKFFMWLLSAIALVALLSVSSFAGFFEKVTLLISVNGTAHSGYTVLDYFVQSTFGGDSVVYYINSISGSDAATTATAATIALSAAALLVVFNYIVDVVCLGAKATKGNVVFDAIRYLLEVVAVATGIILLYITTNICSFETKPGILLWVLLGASIVSAILSLSRCAVKRKAAKPENAQPAGAVVIDDRSAPSVAPITTNATYEPVANVSTSPIYITFYPPYGAPNGAPAPANAPYTVSNTAPKAPAAPAPAPKAESGELPDAYSGPTDPFIDGLAEAEKLEFEKLFIKKENGNFDGVPEYKIGCNNKAFFNAIFLHLSKFRSVLSDGLLGKIYDQTD